MRRIALAALTTLGLALAACATGAPPPPPPPGPGASVLLDWKAVIRPSERDRLTRLNEAWITSIRQVRASGHDEDLRALGSLAEPGAAVRDVTPPLGDWRCRTIKLGAQTSDMPTFTAYAWFTCRIEASPKGLKFTKLTGSQRPSGLLFPDTRKRMVMLGSVALGDEAPANSYGLHADRDLVAVLERLPDDHWRLVLPWPQAESNLDIIELAPPR